MTKGAAAEVKLLVGHSTNMEKLYRNAALTWYSSKVAAASGSPPVSPSAKNVQANQVMDRLRRRAGKGAMEFGGVTGGVFRSGD